MITTLLDEDILSGKMERTFDVTKLSHGLYYLKIACGSDISISKLVL